MNDQQNTSSDVSRQGSFKDSPYQGFDTNNTSKSPYQTNLDGVPQHDSCSADPTNTEYQTASENTTASQQVQFLPNETAFEKPKRRVSKIAIGAIICATIIVLAVLVVAVPGIGKFANPLFETKGAAYLYADTPTYLYGKNVSYTSILVFDSCDNTATKFHEYHFIDSSSAESNGLGFSRVYDALKKQYKKCPGFSVTGKQTDSYYIFETTVELNDRKIFEDMQKEKYWRDENEETECADLDAERNNYINEYGYVEITRREADYYLNLVT